MGRLTGYFRGETLAHARSHGDLFLYGEHRSAWSRSPCRTPGRTTVISPDLSNLPPGRTAVDPATGETFEKKPPQ